MRRTLLAGAAGLALLPAPAQASDLGDIVDALTEAYDGDLTSLIYQLAAFFGIYGQAPNSYLGPSGADLDVMFPDDPDYVTVGDAKWYAAERLADRKGRVDEAMRVASTIITQQPFDSAENSTLVAANVSPVSLFAAIQLGNEGEFANGRQLMKMNGLLAELGQLEADQRAAEDWERVMAYKWAKYHYQDSAFWTGERTWRPETVDTGW